MDDDEEHPGQDSADDGEHDGGDGPHPNPLPEGEGVGVGGEGIQAPPVYFPLAEVTIREGHYYAPELHGLFIPVPPGRSVAEHAYRNLAFLEAQMRASGWRPGETPFIRMKLHCGCIVVWEMPSHVPRENTRCQCGRSWAIIYDVFTLVEPEAVVRTEKRRWS